VALVPLAAILTGVLLLRHIGQYRQADKIAAAVELLREQWAYRMHVSPVVLRFVYPETEQYQSDLLYLIQTNYKL
jgi:hypothetical protein